MATRYIRAMSRCAHVALLVSFLTACGSPARLETDAGRDAEQDGGPGPAFVWERGPDYPEPVAFATGSVITGTSGEQHLYVYGGASVAFTSLPSAHHAEVRRAAIRADHSLGEWEDAGAMSTGASAIALAGHDAIRVRSDVTAGEGIAIAGGGTSSSALPLILVAYADLGGSFSSWGRWTPQLGEGQWFASWDAFEAHHFALVGGLVNGTPSDAVRIAIVENGAMSDTFLEGPALPSARFGHGSAVIGGEVYLVGGASADGALNEILRTTRDTDGHVNGWTSAGELTSRVVFAGAVASGDMLHVIGGLVTGPTGPASNRVFSGAVGRDGNVGRLAGIDGAELPEPLAASIIVAHDGWVYVVGGVAGGERNAGVHTYFARLPP